MPRLFPVTRATCRSVAVALLLLAALGATPSAARPADGSNKARQAAAKQKLAKVKTQIAQLARQEQETANRRDSLNASLARQAHALAQASQAVHRSEQQLAAGQTRLDALKKRRDALDARLATQRHALGDLLRAAYAQGRGSDLRVLLGDRNMSRIARALTYSRYFQHDRMQRIHTLTAALAQLADVQADIDRQQKALQATRDQRKQRMKALTAQREQQKQLLARAKSTLADQHKRMQSLKQDAKSLNDLIARLRDVFADIPKTLPSDIPFARLRGKLPWPAHGHVRHSGGGIVIAAPRGSDVHAVAHGRVVYADWLRGYGMLLIVDQGNGWMTLYGNNESLLAGVGDWVDRGQVIGTAGVGAGREGGVYFEVRHGRKPVNPLPWLRHHG